MSRKINDRHSPSWYFLWAVNANKNTLLHGFVIIGAAVGVLAMAGTALRSDVVLMAAGAVAAVGLVLLLNAILRMRLMYGATSKKRLRRVLSRAVVPNPAHIANLHVGSFQDSWTLAELFPTAMVSSVDVWNISGQVAEGNLRRLRERDVQPAPQPNIEWLSAADTVPLPNQLFDLVVMGLGIQAIPEGPMRDHLFAEAKRILRPDATLLVLEHAADFRSKLVYGANVARWTKRRDWIKQLKLHFTNVEYKRDPSGVAMFMAWTPAANAYQAQALRQLTGAPLARQEIYRVNG